MGIRGLCDIFTESFLKTSIILACRPPQTYGYHKPVTNGSGVGDKVPALNGQKKACTHQLTLKSWVKSVKCRHTATTERTSSFSRVQCWNNSQIGCRAVQLFQLFCVEDQTKICFLSLSMQILD